MPRPAWRRKTPNNKFIFLTNLDLQPRRRATRYIFRREIFRDQALEALPLSDFKRLDAVRIEPRRENQIRGWFNRLFQCSTPFRQRSLPQVLAVAIDAVKESKNRLPLALLQKLKPRHFVGVENHDFAVYRQRVSLQLGDCLRDLGIAPGSINRIARDQRNLRTFFIRQHANAVVFLLINPAGPVEWGIHQCREHRGYAKGNSSHAYRLRESSWTYRSQF